MSLHFITSALSSYNKDEDSIVVIGRVQSLQHDDQKVEMLLFSFSSYVRNRTGLAAFQHSALLVRTGLSFQSEDLKGVTLGQIRI